MYIHTTKPVKSSMKLLKNDLDGLVHMTYKVEREKTKTLHNPVDDSPPLYGALLSLFQEK